MLKKDTKSSSNTRKLWEAVLRHVAHRSTTSGKQNEEENFVSMFMMFPHKVQKRTKSTKKQTDGDGIWKLTGLQLGKSGGLYELGSI